MLDRETQIEIIEIKDNKYHKIIMTVYEWSAFKKKTGFTYQSFQLGFSQFKLE